MIISYSLIKIHVLTVWYTRWEHIVNNTDNKCHFRLFTHDECYLRIDQVDVQKDKHKTNYVHCKEQIPFVASLESGHQSRIGHYQFNTYNKWVNTANNHCSERSIVHGSIYTLAITRFNVMFVNKRRESLSPWAVPDDREYVQIRSYMR